MSYLPVTRSVTGAFGLMYIESHRIPKIQEEERWLVYERLRDGPIDNGEGSHEIGK